MRCDWKRRFNSAAFEKLSHCLGGWAGHVIAKVVGFVEAKSSPKKCHVSLHVDELIFL